MSRIRRAARTPETATGYGASTLMAAGAFFFSVMAAFVKVASEHQPTMQIVLARSVVVAVLAAATLVAGGRRIAGRQRALLLVRGLLGFIALSCVYFAIAELPLADATTIQFTNPVFTALLAALVLGEAIHLREIGLMAVSLVGVVLVARPTTIFGAGVVPLSPIGVGVGLVGAIFSAGAYVAVRRLRDEDTMVIVLYFALVSTLGSVPLVVSGWVPPTPLELWILLAVGVSTYLGQLFITMGLKRERAGRATAIGYLQIVFAGLWGLLFFGEVPDRWGVGGAALIVGGTFLLSRLKEPRSVARSAG